jgi:hypothetical protein
VIGVARRTVIAAAWRLEIATLRWSEKAASRRPDLNLMSLLTSLSTSTFLTMLLPLGFATTDENRPPPFRYARRGGDLL